MTRPSSRGSAQRTRSSSARRTSTSSPRWDRRPRTAPSSATKNPWDLARTAGGTSGGSAALVAARFASGSLGTDTGGSIRQPAAFTGTVGIKPTYGRVSRYGLIAFASSLDQVGPVANDVRGAARILDVIAGKDPKDATRLDVAGGGCEEACGREVACLTVGVPPEYFAKGLDPEVEKSVREAISGLERLGCKIRARSRSRIRATRSPPTTSSRPPRPRPTSRASTASGSASASPSRATIWNTLYSKTRGEGFWP